LKTIGNKLHSVEQYHPAIGELESRLRSTQVELQDIADELEKVDNGIQFNPARVQLLNERMSLGYRLLKKHAVNTTAELLATRDSLEGKLNDILNIGEAIIAKEKAVNEDLLRCKELAAVMSVKRQGSIQPFSQKVNQLLVQVGMPSAQVKVDMHAGELSINGSDEIMYLFDANKTGRFEALSKIASGGELSRIMLCIKSLVARKLQLPTLIFDEIDSGISGEAARQVALIMKDLSQDHQLISITHQPQIAAKASAHYFVYKSAHANKVLTSIRLLNDDERITTIAQMLSGESPTAAALQNAREMVNSNA